MKKGRIRLSLSNNSWIKIFRSYLLKIIRELDQQNLIQILFKSELNINEIIIKESSKPIIDILNIRNNNKINKELNKSKIIDERNTDLLYYCLLQFKGLNRYLKFHGILKDDIRKISNYIINKKKKKGEYIFRTNEKSKYLYGLIKGKNEYRKIKYIDKTGKFKIDMMKDNFKNISFKEEIPFELFMSDCEDDGQDSLIEENEEKEEEEEEEEKSNSENEEKKLEFLSKLTEEDIDRKIDNIIIKEKRKKIDLKVKPIKEEKKEYEIINIIKAINKHQTPDFYFNKEENKEILEQFIKEFEYIEKEILPGECFGELNLVNKNFMNDPIICIEDSEYFCLERDIFKKLLLKRFNKSHTDKIRFIANKFPIFKNEMKTSNLLNQIIPYYYEKETLIYSPFDKAENLYLVYQGECHLISIDNIKNKDDSIQSNKTKIISKLLVGGIAGYESCLNQNNYYENTLIVKKPYTILFKINVNYINQIYKGFIKSINPLYQEQKFIYDDLSKKNKEILRRLFIKKQKINDLYKREINEEKKQKRNFSNDKHLNKICLSTERNIFEKKKDFFKKIKIGNKRICLLKYRKNLLSPKTNLSPNNNLSPENNISSNFSLSPKTNIISRNNLNYNSLSTYNNLSNTNNNCNSDYNLKNTKKIIIHKKNQTTSFLKFDNFLTINKTNYSDFNTISNFINICKNKNKINNLKLTKRIKKNFNVNDIFKNYKSGKYKLPFVSYIINTDENLM